MIKINDPLFTENLKKSITRLWSFFIVIGLFLIVIFYMLVSYRQIFNPLLSQFVCVLLSLIYILGLYLTFVNRILYIKRVLKFINMSKVDNITYESCEIVSVDASITLNNLKFIPLNVHINTHEKTFYLLSLSDISILSDTKVFDIKLYDHFITEMKP